MSDDMEALIHNKSMAILAEGGLTTRLPVIRPVLGLAGVLATIGVAISVTSLKPEITSDLEPRSSRPEPIPLPRPGRR